MSEPSVSKEEMLDELDCCVHNASVLFGIDKRSKLVLDAIRALIEHGPEVSREFVEKWRGKIIEIEIGPDYPETSSTEYTTRFRIKDNIISMLTEAGVTVKED